MNKPVQQENPETPETIVQPKIALALSGGGYRATIFALGALIRLNEFGMLPRLTTITSVSGGSIASALLAKCWGDLKFGENGVAINFHELIETPLQNFCQKSIDVKSVLGGLLSFGHSIGDKVAQFYDRNLYKGLSLKDINNYETAPLFIFYGTNMQTGSSIRLSPKYISDWQIGRNEIDDIPLAKAVGISSAFPPVLSPVNLRLNPNNWVPSKYSQYSYNEHMKRHLVLTDGGLYDNMGLEAVTKNKEYDYVIVCDAGAPFKVQENAKTNWASQTIRMTDIMINQQRALRRRKFFEDINDGKLKGTYFGIGTTIKDYVDNAQKHFGFALHPLINDSERTKKLSLLPTRLSKLSTTTIIDLKDWGHALCDAALYCWCNELTHSKKYK